MELRISPEPPEVMHIDLNSAFAMTEQQANPLLRGRPVGITNRLNDYAICITSSYEARRLGITIGTRNREARLIAPDFTMLESDAAKYQYIHARMRSIFESYSPQSYMKSVDEGIIDFRGLRKLLKGRRLEDIGREIKQRVREEVGDYMSVNIGIAQNLWLAKLAASFNKPDGLTTITGADLEGIFATLYLTDLPYIKARMQARLNAAGIYSSHEFFCAPEIILTKRVFRSINGHHWYLKLRGYETEVPTGIRTVGRNYVLEHRTADPEELAALFYKAAIKVARRLQRNNLAARGLMLSLRYASDGSRREGWGYHCGGSWRERQMFATAVRRGDQLYHRTMELFARSEPGRPVKHLELTSYGLTSHRSDQLALYETEDVRAERVEDAINAVSDRYGDLVIQPAAVFASKNPMKDKIPFGTIRYFS